MTRANGTALYRAQRELPEWLDRAVETRHADLPLAVLSAFAEAQRISAPSSRASVPMVGRHESPLYSRCAATTSRNTATAISSAGATGLAQHSNFGRELQSAQMLIRFGFRIVILVGFASFGGLGFVRSCRPAVDVGDPQRRRGLIRREVPFAPRSITGTKPWPTPRCSAWRAGSTTFQAEATRQAYATPMRMRSPLSNSYPPAKIMKTRDRR